MKKSNKLIDMCNNCFYCKKYLLDESLYCNSHLRGIPINSPFFTKSNPCPHFQKKIKESYKWKFQKWLINKQHNRIYNFLCRIHILHHTIYELF